MTLLNARSRRGLRRVSFTPDEYRKAREARGTQADVARYLRVSRVTIARRETGKFKITHEATLALLSMPVTTPEAAPAP